MEEIRTKTITTSEMESSVLHLDSTSSFELQGISTSLLDDDSEAVVIDSGIAPFLEGNDNNGSQIVFKGILEQNGTFVLDPAQFAAFIENTGGKNNTLPFLTTTANRPAQQPIMVSLNSLNQSQKSRPLIISNDYPPRQYSNLISQGPMITLPSTNQFVSTTMMMPPSSIADSFSASLPTTANNFNNNANATAISIASNSNSENRQPRPPSHSQEYHPNDLFEVEPPIGRGPHRCKDCGKVFLKWPQFKRHRAEHLDEKAFRCTLCSTTFNFEVNLKLHIMIHDAEISGSLECQMCPAKFSRLASLKSHIRVHEKEENLVCPECGDEFATKARLDTHIEEHKTTKPLIHRCKLCGKTFTHLALLKDHSKEHTAVRNQLKILNHHKRRKPITASPTKFNLNYGNNDPDYNNTSSSSPYWSKARQKVENRKKMICNVCSKRFQKPSQLSRHMRIHTGEKPYACKDCGRSFNQKGTLESHVLSMHEKLKPFVCHLCQCQFSQRGNLKAHVLKVHVPPGDNEKAFKCQECSCVYRRLATLNNHIAKAHTKSVPAENNAYPNDTTVENGSSCSNLPVTTRPNPITGAVNNGHEGMSSYTISNNNSNGNYIPPVNQAITVIPSSSNGQRSDDPEVTETEVRLAHESVDGLPNSTTTCTVVKVKHIGQDKWHCCPHNCSKSFRKPSDLMRHIRIHTRERPFTCGICKKSFAIKSTLNTHMKTHSSIKDWECRDCHRRFSALTSLRAHERLHTGAKPFPCMQCGKHFRTSSQRKVHFKSHSRNSQGPTGKRRLLRIGDTNPVVELPDPLKITSEGLISVPNRASESIIKPDDSSGPAVEKIKNRPYRCTMCPSAFKKSSHLKQHNRSHSGERPYKCYQCFRSFVSTGVLKNHIKTHEGVRAFKCNICQLSFTTNGSLTRHKFTHSEDRLFLCPYCSKSFKTNVSCRKHIKTHRDRTDIVAFHSKSSANTTAVLSDVTVSSNNVPTSSEINVSQNVVINNVINNNNGIISHGHHQSLNNIYADVVPQQQSNVIIHNPYHDHFSYVEGESAAEVNGNIINSSAILGGNNNSLHLVTFPSTITDRNNPSDCISMQQQIQDITELIESGRHLDEDGGEPTTTLQYSESIDDDVVHHITLAEGQSFVDGSIFALQGDSIDIPVSLSSLLPPPNPQQQSQINVPISISSIVSQQQPPTTSNIQRQKQPISIVRVPSSSSADVGGEQKIAKNSSSSRCNENNHNQHEANRIREATRPISEQIYNEIKASSNAKVKLPDENNQDISGMMVEQDKTKTNICSHCGRGFRKRSDMIRHVRIHTGEKPFCCTMSGCKKTFRVKSTRDSHVRTHVGTKTVACHVCNNLFSTKSSLRVHIRLHTGTKPYGCPHCPRLFRTSGHRKTHVLSHFKPKKDNLATTSTSISSAKSNVPANPLSNQKKPNNSVSNARSSSSEQNITFVDNSTPILPPVETIKENNKNVDSVNTDALPYLGNLPLTLDGSTVQNCQNTIHITGLDLSNLQISEEFLQSFGNVILVTPNQLAGTQSTSNDIIGDHNSHNIETALQDHHQQEISSNILTGKDVNVGSTSSAAINIMGSSPSLISQQIQNSISSLVAMGELDGLISTENSNNSLMTFTVPSSGGTRLLVTNNSPMLSSSPIKISNASINNAVISTSSSEASGSGTGSTSTAINNKECPECGKVFLRPSLLKRHMTTHTGSKPFKCDICNCAFSQKNSLDVHKYTHSNDNERPFSCHLCPFKSVTKQALKKHFSRAHPDVNWMEVCNNLTHEIQIPSAPSAASSLS